VGYILSVPVNLFPHIDHLEAAW